MAQLKSTNILGNLAVSGDILSSKIIKLGGANNQVLLANGDVKEISGTWPISISGNAATANALPFTVLTTQDALDAFIEAGKLKYGLWRDFTPSGVCSNGLLISGGWVANATGSTATNYGFQLAIDDDPTHLMYLRQKNSSGWAAWKQIPMGDGTGASGTWSISVSGSAETATSAKNLSNYYSSRPTTIKPTIVGNGSLQNFKCTSNCTDSDKPGDGHILHFNWDNTGGYDAQLWLSTSTGHMKYRGMNAGIWTEWHTVLSTGNYASSLNSVYVKLSECSNAGNRVSGKVVTAAAAGQINSDKYLVTSSGTGKVTLQYNTIYKALEFSF